MNWILTILFLVVFSLLNISGGSALLQASGYNNNSKMKSWIIGYFAMFFILFFPGQLAIHFHISWNLYVIISLILLAGFYAYSIWFLFKNKKTTLSFKKLKFDQYIHKSIKFIFDYWLLIVFVALFMAFSIANQLAYLSMNYDDAYYIGKMVDQIGSASMMMENYADGGLDPLINLDFARVMNTYEISYALLAWISGIYPVFFMRVTMAVCSYMLFSFSLMCIARQFLPVSIRQFVLTPFFLFLLPQGFFMEMLPDNLVFYSYDLWQFTNAAYYGSSVVRMSGIFVLYYFAYPMISKFSFRKLLIVAMLTLSLTSFSTIAVSLFICFASAMVLIKCYSSLVKSIKNRKWIIFILSLIISAALIYIGCRLNSITELNEKMQRFLQITEQSVERFYSKDPFTFYSWILIPLLLIFSWRKSGLYLSLYALVFFLILLPFRATLLQFLMSCGVLFVYRRVLASYQYLMVFIFGLSILLILYWPSRWMKKISWMKKTNWIIPAILSIITILGTIQTFVTNQEAFKNDIKFNGSGISKYGWDFSRLLNFDENMVPPFIKDLGDEIKKINEPRIRLYTQALYSPGDNGENYGLSPGNLLAISSKPAVLNLGGHLGIDPEDFKRIESFIAAGNYSEEFLSLLEKNNVPYFLSTNEDASIALQQLGAEELFSIPMTENNKAKLYRFNWISSEAPTESNQSIR